MDVRSAAAAAVLRSAVVRVAVSVGHGDAARVGAGADHGVQACHEGEDTEEIPDDK